MNIPILRIKGADGIFYSVPAIKGDKGDRGPKGADGTGVTILGSYDSLEQLQQEHPTGNPGDSYLINGDLYVWDATNNIWKDVGSIQGPKGDTPNITAGTTTTTNPGTDATVTKSSSSTEVNAVFDFTIPRGDKGEKGDTGNDGVSATVEVGSTITGDPGTDANVTNSGTNTNAVFNFTIPKGDQGIQGDKGNPGAVFTPSVNSDGVISWTNNGGLDNPSSQNIKGVKGDKGDQGETGSTPNVTVGTTTTGDAGTDASVVKNTSSTEDNVILDFTIPKGDTGSQGPQGNPGDKGDTGAVFTPSVSDEGIISWSNNGGLNNPTSVNIKGPQGSVGPKGEQGIQGPSGKAATVAVGNTTTADPGGSSSVTNSGTETDAIFNFVIPRGDKGDRGDKGETGATPNISVGTVTTGSPGTDAVVEKNNSSTSTNAIFDFTIPSGLQGIRGEQGSAATVSVGTTTTTDPGKDASVTNSGTTSEAVLNFSIPRGEQGPQGEQGDSATISGMTASVDEGVGTPSVDVTISGTNLNRSFDLSFHNLKGVQGEQGIQGPEGPQGPKGEDGTGVTILGSYDTVAELESEHPTGSAGDSYLVSGDLYVWDATSNSWKNVGTIQGPKGDPGSAATITVGTTTTGDPGTSATVTNSGTSGAAIFNFVIPKGDKGEQGSEGPSGPAATVSVGTTVTGNEGSDASVTNSGTSSNAIFNFTIPKGSKGDQGPSGEKGDTGTTFTPTVSSEGVISWTNDGGLSNPTSVNIKGPQGDPGTPGKDGTNGTDGSPGKDGTSATIEIGTTTTVDPGVSASVTNSGSASAAVFNFSIPKGEKGEKGDAGQDGSQGETGPQGPQGDQGPNGTTFTPSVSDSGIISWTNDGGLENPSSVDIKGPQGEKGDKGDQGIAATITVGTTTTVSSDNPASVVNSGTESAAILNFTIPKGADGTDGTTNLLTNSYFLDPINQRGKTSYSGSSYSIDRWFGDSGTSITISTGTGITVSGGNLNQYIEIQELTVSNSFTCSGELSTGNIYTLTVDDLSSSNGSNDYFSISWDNTRKCIKFSLKPGTWRWAKLEIGSYNSLYSPRTRAEEIQRCLRYYYRIQQENSDFNYFGGGVTNTSTNTFFVVSLPTYMNGMPTISTSGSFRCYGGDNTTFNVKSVTMSPYTATSTPVDGQVSVVTLMAVRSSGTNTGGHVYSLNGTTNGGYIEFDCEIY
mgnify:CR=1 FL=1